MAGTLILKGTVNESLPEEELDDLREKWEEKARVSGDFKQVKGYFQDEKDVKKFGFSVKSNLSELANNPGNGRYLGIFIVGEEGELISEKFISNPAIKHEKGRTNLAFSILKQNGIDHILLREEPENEQQQILNELEMAYQTVTDPRLEALRNLSD